MSTLSINLPLQPAISHLPIRMDSRDDRILKILLRIARFCGTIPAERCCTHYQQILIFTVTFIWSVRSMYHMATEFYQFLNNIDVFIDILTSFFLMLQGSFFQLHSLWHRTACSLFWELSPLIS